MGTADNLPYSFNEKDKSGNESWDLVQGSRELERIFEGPWANRYDFIEKYLGIQLLDGNTALGNSHPLDIQAKPARLSISGIGSTNIDTSTTFISYDRAIINVNYQRFPYALVGITGDRSQDHPDFLYLSESFSSEIELLELEEKNIVLRAGGPAGDEKVTTKKHQFPIHFLNYNINVPIHTTIPTPEDYTDFDASDDFDLIAAFTRVNGQVNKYTVRTFSGLVFPAFTLAFQGMQSESNQSIFIEDRLVYSTQFSFKYNPVRWDYTYDANAAGVIGLWFIDPPPVVDANGIEFENVWPKLFTKYQA